VRVPCISNVFLDFLAREAMEGLVARSHSLVQSELSFFVISNVDYPLEHYGYKIIREISGNCNSSKLIL
jgi:hypothetical protein